MRPLALASAWHRDRSAAGRTARGAAPDHKETDGEPDERDAHAGGEGRLTETAPGRIVVRKPVLEMPT
jgi:hypothetical protein